MASVNASRRGIAPNVTESVEDARLIGFNDEGLACVWYGGAGFNVYDAVGDWHEVDYFTSGDMFAISDTYQDADKEKLSIAKDRMESEGFQPIE